MIAALTKTIQNSCYYIIFRDADKRSFFTWVSVGVGLGLALILPIIIWM